MMYLVSNSFEFSQNSEKVYDDHASASEFREIESDGYSVYIDGEIQERTISVALGLFDYLEIQLSYRDIRFAGGTWDTVVEDFHSAIGHGEAGRDRTGRNQFEVYVYDNETNEIVWQMTDPKSSSNLLAYNLGLKLRLTETEDEALSIKLNSNFSDRYIEQDLNEIDTTADKPSFKNFNDFNVSIYYTSKFSWVTLHTALSYTFMTEKVLDKSPKRFMHYFIGGNFHFFDFMDIIVQNLFYSSIYPKNEFSNIGENPNEITFGFRFFPGETGQFDIGMVENYTQGPHNIDVAFFANIGFGF